MTCIAVVDTETTGLDLEKDCIVELACIPIKGPPWKIDLQNATSSLVKPTCPIQIPAMATHHITEDMVMFAAEFDMALQQSKILDAQYVAAHSADFDFGFIKIDKPIICTYRCAKHLWPDAPSFKNQALRYWLPNLDIELYDSQSIMALPPHRALFDAWTTAHILMRMLDEHNPEELIRLTGEPILLKTVGFGKHYGELWSDVPSDYLRWILKQDFDADTKHTAMHWGMARKAQ